MPSTDDDPRTDIELYAFWEVVKVPSWSHLHLQAPCQRGFEAALRFSQEHKRNKAKTKTDKYSFRTGKEEYRFRANVLASETMHPSTNFEFPQSRRKSTCLGVS